MVFLSYCGGSLSVTLYLLQIVQFEGTPIVAEAPIEGSELLGKAIGTSPPPALVSRTQRTRNKISDRNRKQLGKESSDQPEEFPFRVSITASKGYYVTAPPHAMYPQFVNTTPHAAIV